MRKDHDPSGAPSIPGMRHFLFCVIKCHDLYSITFWWCNLKTSISHRHSDDIFWRLSFHITFRWWILKTSFLHRCCSNVSPINHPCFNFNCAYSCRNTPLRNMSIQNAGYGPFSQIWSQICEAVVALHKVNVKGLTQNCCLHMVHDGTNWTRAVGYRL